MKPFLKQLIENSTKTVGEKTEVDQIVTAALILQKIFGQQVLDPNWSWKSNRAHYVVLISIFIYTFFGTLKTLRYTDSPDLLAEASYTIVMMSIFWIKLLLFIKNRNIFHELYLSAKTTLLEHIKENGSSKHILSNAKAIVYLLFAMVTIPVISMELLFMWNYLNGARIPLSRSTDILMPLESPCFEIAWLLHSILLFEISTTIIMDMWFVLLTFFLCASNDRLVSILNVNRNEVNDSMKSYEGRLNQSLRNFYKCHVKQTEFLNKLNEMYGFLAFVPLCNAAISICIILLVLSKDINWKFMPHLLPMFAEVFAYNWFGEQIKTKAQHINDALLKFDWMNLQTKDKKSYYIIMTYIKKEFGIKSANNMHLSLLTMTEVLKMSYQAYTVLQTMSK